MLEPLLFGVNLTNIPGFWVIISMIGLDIIFGLLASAKERKLNSSVNFDGLIRKTGEILSIILFTIMDSYLKGNGAITSLGVMMMFIYEALSIIENASRIGLNLNFLTQFFDKDKVGGQKNDKNYD